MNFLKYVSAPLERVEEDFKDEYVEKLQKAVKAIKQSREMGARYMTFEELLRDERRLGREEGREELLGELIRKKIAKGLAIKEIAEALEISVEELEKWRKQR